MQHFGFCRTCRASGLDDIFSFEIDNLLFDGKIRKDKSGIKTIDPKSVSCRNGHVVLLLIENLKYTVLLQQGIESFRNGFYFESFHTLYAAYEAYKIDYVGAFILEKTMNIYKTEDFLSKINRSEKIDGAFATAYTSLNLDLPPTLGRDNREFRNKVVHAGKIPTKKDCEKFGNKICKIIAETNYKLQKTPSEISSIHGINMSLSNYQHEKSNSILSNANVYINYYKFLSVFNFLDPVVDLDEKDVHNNIFNNLVNDGENILNNN